MKRTFYTSILLAVLLQSCLPEHDKDLIGWRFVLGEAGKNGDVSFITTDDSHKVLMKNINFPDSVVNASERLYIEGNMYKGKGGFDYEFDAAGYAFVPIKEVQDAANQDIIDFANNASMSIDNNRVWQTNKYFNMFLDYYGSVSKKHSFDFFINSETEKFENNMVTIYICHNNGGDNVTAQGYSTLFSLDLTYLFEKFTEDFNIQFVYYIDKSETKKVLFPIKRF